MNTPNEHLFQLILSLDFSERRSFSRLIGQHLRKGRNLQQELFYAIATQESYNEALLLEQFSKELSPRNFAATKFRLYQSLLRFLNENQAGQLAAQEHQNLQSITTLADRDLPEQARKHLRSGVRKARKLERAQQLLALNSQELHLEARQKRRHQLEHIRQLVGERKLLIDSAFQESTLKGLYEYATSLTVLTNKEAPQGTQEDWEYIQQHPVLQEPPSTFLNGAYQAHIKGMLAFQQRDIPRAFEVYQAYRAGWSSRSHLISVYPNLYFRFQVNFLNACLRLQKEALMRSSILEVQGQLNHMQGGTGFHQRQIYYLHLMYCMNFGDIKRGETLIEEISQWLQKLANPLPSEQLIPFSFNFAVFYFLTGHFRKALRPINDILFQGKLPQYPRIRRYAQIFELIIHFELGNVSYVESRLRALSRSSNFSRERAPFEALVLSQLNKLLKAAPQALDQIRENFRALIRDFPAEHPGPPPMGHQEITFWLEARQTGTPIQQLYQRALAER